MEEAHESHLCSAARTRLSHPPAGNAGTRRLRDTSDGPGAEAPARGVPRHRRSSATPGGRLSRPARAGWAAALPRSRCVVQRRALRAFEHADGTGSRDDAHRRVSAPHRDHRERVAQPRDRRARIQHRRPGAYVYRPQDAEARRHQSEEPSRRDRRRRASPRRSALEGYRDVGQGPWRDPSSRKDRHRVHVSDANRPVRFEHVLHGRASEVGRGFPRTQARGRAISVASGDRFSTTRRTRSRFPTSRSGTRRAASCRRSSARRWRRRARCTTGRCCRARSATS